MPARDLILAASGASLPSDPDFEYVTLLLDGNGTNGGQNNTFVDSSTNNFTITRNGNTTQGSFSPYGDLWSNIFTTTTSRLTCGSASDWTFLSNGASDWTIDGWIFYSAADGDIVNTSGGSAQVGMQLYFGSPSSGLLTVYFTNGAPGAAGGSSSSGMTANQWNYFAITFTSSTKVVAYYINGVSAGTNTHSGFSFSASNPNFAARIGNSLFGSQGGGANTMLSNIRISDTVRTGLTTIPTAPYSSDGNTKLLVCNSNSFVDKSANNYSVSVNSTPSVQRFSPFEPSAPYSTSVIGGSGYFDGSGDYLSVASQTALGMGSGDFTYEAWVYVNETVPTNAVRGLFDSRISGATGCGIYTSADSGNTAKLVYATNSAIAASSTNTIPSFAWSHIAVTRSGTTVRGFINGVLEFTYTDSRTFASSAGTFVGADVNATVFNGFITDARILKGTAQYTAAFTPNTAPLTAITNTSLLLNTTNASIFDYAMMNNLETVGNAQVSTSVKKFGTGSLAFDGSGDYLKSNSATSDLYAFGTGDFTIEMWAYFNVVNADQSLYDGRPTGTNGAYQHIYLEGATGKILYQANTNTQITSGSSLSASTWYHIALSRSGTSTKLFINGTQSGSTYTDSSNYTVASGRPFIGINASNTSVFNLNGYIDDLRVTKGIARYTANFTAPTAPFPIY